jgi:hypothetical protein
MEDEWEDGACRFELVPMGDVPYAHNPFKCEHIARFDPENASEGDGEWMDRATEAGRAFFHSLTARDFRRCEYHKPDWKMIASCAADVVALKPTTIVEHLAACAAVAKRRKLRKRDQEWFFSLFTLPINFGPHAGHVSDGQHRICGLRAAGVEFCVVRTD